MRSRVPARLAARVPARRAAGLLACLALVGGLFPWVTATFAATGEPDMWIVKTLTKGPIVPNSSATFQLLVGNSGTGPMPGQIVAGDNAPVGLTIVSASGTGWSCQITAQAAGCSRAEASIAAGTTLPPLMVTATTGGPIGMPLSFRNCSSVLSSAQLTQTWGVPPIEPNTSNNFSCIDAPTLVPGTLCVVKFNDADGNGSRGAGEAALPGWSFTVTSATTGGSSVSVTTGADGRGCVNRPAGPYTVSEIAQPGWVQTTPTPTGPRAATILGGETTTLTFGNRRDRCCLALTFGAGKPDNFSVGDGAAAEVSAEAPHPSTGTYETHFDGRVNGRIFTNRIVLPTGQCIAAASYTIRLKPIAARTLNDLVVLRVPGTGGAAWSKGLVPLSSATPPGSAWALGKPPRTFTWNLDALPLGGASLLAALNAKRVLDTTVQDDASVDFIRLTVTFCDCTATATSGSTTGTVTGN